MKEFYVYNTGIKFWESIEGENDARYATITVVHTNIIEITSYWKSIAKKLSCKLPKTVKWLTLGIHENLSKVQEHKFIKDLKRYAGVDGKYYKDNETNIYSYVKNLSFSAINIDLNDYSAYRYTAVIFTSNQSYNLDMIHDAFKEVNSCMTSKIMLNILQELPGVVICRIYECEDTHAAIQYIGAKEDVEIVRTYLRENNVDLVSEDDIGHSINTRFTD